MERSKAVSIVILASGRLATSLKDRMLAKDFGLKCTGIGSSLAVAVWSKLSDPPLVTMWSSSPAAQG